jgi:hypothetical protein
MTDVDGVEVVPCRVADELREELPGLGLLALELDAAPGRSPSGVRERLRAMSSRFRGADAVHMRRAAVPHAHRVFFRHDAARAAGALELRLSLPDERLGRSDRAVPLPAGRIVVADAGGPLALLFGELAPGHGVTPATRRMRLFAIAVPHVPAIHVEEALATAADVLRS